MLKCGNVALCWGKSHVFSRQTYCLDNLNNMFTSIIIYVCCHNYMFYEA